MELELFIVWTHFKKGVNNNTHPLHLALFKDYSLTGNKKNHTELKITFKKSPTKSCKMSSASSIINQSSWSSSSVTVSVLVVVSFNIERDREGPCHGHQSWLCSPDDNQVSPADAPLPPPPPSSTADAEAGQAGPPQQPPPPLEQGGGCCKHRSLLEKCLLVFLLIIFLLFVAFLIGFVILYYWRGEPRCKSF